MVKPNVLVVRAPGTNCDAETAFAFELAGARAERIHVNRLLEDRTLLRQFQILCIPGGFSYGDDVSAGKILASKIQHHLVEPLREFHTAGNLLLGICNGFQVLLKSGLLFSESSHTPATLTWNDTGRYEARWVSLKTASERCVFLRGIDRIELPVAHAEGKFVTRDASVMRHLESNGQLALRYVEPPEVAEVTECCGASIGANSRRSRTGASANEDVPFPFNPNGSQQSLAGLCDPTGRAFGLMPHPERFMFSTQHPRWTREGLRPSGDGLLLFQNAVEYFE